MTWYLSYGSLWSCPILDCSSDILLVWFPFVWRRYIAFLRSCVVVSSWIATPAAGSSSSLVGLWGLSGVSFDVLMVFTWETGEFLFFPVFFLQNFFFFLGGILFFGLEGREFISPFPISASAGNISVALPPSPGRSVLSSSYATPFWCLAMALASPSPLPPPSSFSPPLSHPPVRYADLPLISGLSYYSSSICGARYRIRYLIPASTSLSTSTSTLIMSLEERRGGRAPPRSRGGQRTLFWRYRQRRLQSLMSL